MTMVGIKNPETKIKKLREGIIKLQNEITVKADKIYCMRNEIREIQRSMNK